MISWTNTDATDTDVLFTVYNAAGTQTGSGNTSFGGGTNSNNESSVVALADGSFVILYDNDELDRQDVEHYSATGTFLGTFN